MAPRTGSAAGPGSASMSKVRYGPPMASGSASTSAAPPRQPGPSSPPGVVVTTPPAQSRSLPAGKHRQSHDGAVSAGEQHSSHVAPNLPESISAGIEAAAALNAVVADDTDGAATKDAAAGEGSAQIAVATTVAPDAEAQRPTPAVDGGTVHAAQPAGPPRSAAMAAEVQPTTLATGGGGLAAAATPERNASVAPAPSSATGAAPGDAVGVRDVPAAAALVGGERSAAVAAKRELLGELVEQLAARAYQAEQALSSEQRANRALRVTLEALQRQNVCLQQQVALLAQSYQGAGLVAAADGVGLTGVAP